MPAILTPASASLANLSCKEICLGACDATPPGTRTPELGSASDEASSLGADRGTCVRAHSVRIHCPGVGFPHSMSVEAWG